jgi:hypothetical protein
MGKNCIFKKIGRETNLSFVIFLKIIKITFVQKAKLQITYFNVNPNEDPSPIGKLQAKLNQHLKRYTSGIEELIIF